MAPSWAYLGLLLAALFQACRSDIAELLQSSPEFEAKTSAIRSTPDRKQAAAANATPVARRLQPAPSPPPSSVSENIFGSGAVTTTNFNMKQLIGPIVGGAVGAAAIGGVIALSVIKSTEKEHKVTGSMILQVPDVAAFVNDVTFQDAVKEGIADAAGVPASYVTVTAHPGRRLLERRLLGDAKVDYVITIPKDDSFHNPDGVQNALGSKSATDLTNAIQKRVTIAKGSGTKLSVVSSQVQNKPMVTQAPTTTLPGISTNNGVGTTDNFLNLPESGGGNFNGPTTPSFGLRARETATDGGDSSSSGIWLGIAAVVAACCVAALIAACLQKCFTGKKRSSSKRQASERDMNLDYEKVDIADSVYEQQPYMNPGTRMDLPNTSADMYAQPDYASQYTGSAYMQGSQYAAMGGPMAGMTSMPPPPPPPPGGYQASPLANTWAPPSAAGMAAMPTYDGLSLTNSQYGMRPGQPPMGFNQPGLVGMNY
jgi:hypothetical protein